MTEIKDSAARAKIEGLAAMVEQDRRDNLRQFAELGSTVDKLKIGQDGVRRRLDDLSDKMDSVANVTDDIATATTSIRFLVKWISMLFGASVALAAAYTAFTGTAPFQIVMVSEAVAMPGAL